MIYFPSTSPSLFFWFSPFSASVSGHVFSLTPRHFPPRGFPLRFLFSAHPSSCPPSWSFRSSRSPCRTLLPRSLPALGSPLRFFRHLPDFLLWSLALPAGARLGFLALCFLVFIFFCPGAAYFFRLTPSSLSRTTPPFVVRRFWRSLPLAASLSFGFLTLCLLRCHFFVTVPMAILGAPSSAASRLGTLWPTVSLLPVAHGSASGLVLCRCLLPIPRPRLLLRCSLILCPWCRSYPVPSLTPPFHSHSPVFSTLLPVWVLFNLPAARSICFAFSLPPL